MKDQTQVMGVRSIFLAFTFSSKFHPDNYTYSKNSNPIELTCVPETLLKDGTRPYPLI